MLVYEQKKRNQTYNIKKQLLAGPAEQLLDQIWVNYANKFSKISEKIWLKYNSNKAWQFLQNGTYKQ